MPLGRPPEGIQGQFPRLGENQDRCGAGPGRPLRRRSGKRPSAQDSGPPAGPGRLCRLRRSRTAGPGIAGFRCQHRRGTETGLGPAPCTPGYRGGAYRPQGYGSGRDRRGSLLRHRREDPRPRGFPYPGLPGRQGHHRDRLHHRFPERAGTYVPVESRQDRERRHQRDRCHPRPVGG